MITKNSPSTSLYHLIKHPINLVKKLSNELSHFPQIHRERKRVYDLETVLADWEIDSDHFLAEVLMYISRTSTEHESIKDVKDARFWLGWKIRRLEKTYDLAYELFGRIEPIPNPKIKALTLIEDWKLPYHQGRAIEYIYKALFEEGQESIDTLKEARDVLYSRLMMLEDEAY